LLNLRAYPKNSTINTQTPRRYNHWNALIIAESTLLFTLKHLRLNLRHSCDTKAHSSKLMKKTPTDIRLHTKSRILEVAFADEVFKLPCEYLRVYSPSAEVKGHGPGQEVLQVGKEAINIVAITHTTTLKTKLTLAFKKSMKVKSKALLVKYSNRWRTTTTS